MNASGSCSRAGAAESRLRSRAPNLKGATSRFDKSDRNRPDYPSVAARLGPARSGTIQAGHAPRPWHARIPGTNAELRGDAVLVDQAAEPVGSLDSVNAGELPKGRVGDWDLEVDPAVRALIVVMLDELPQYTVEMSLAADEQPVQALGPGCPHEPLGERVRSGRPHGCEDDPGADRPHHLVEGTDELGVTVADQEPDGSALVLEGDYQVPGLLGDPGPDRVSRHAGQEHLPALEVDEEQHIDAGAA